MLHDALGHLPHRQTQVHRRLLDPPEGLGLAQSQLLLQDPLGALDGLAGGQRLGEVGDLALELAISPNRLTAISIAGTRSVRENGLTR